MRINNSYEINQAAVSTTKAAAPPPSQASDGAAASQGAEAGEKVTVSAEAQRLASAASDADNAKVQALATSLHNGTFKIDAHAIAARIVDGG